MILLTDMDDQQDNESDKASEFIPEVEQLMMVQFHIMFWLVTWCHEH